MNISTAVRHVVGQTKSFGPAAALHDLRVRTVNGLGSASFKILKGMTAVQSHVDDRLPAPGFDGRFATREELVAATARLEIANEMSAVFVDWALHRGDECFALFDRGEVASFGWYSTRPTPIEDDLIMHFDPAWVYAYKGYTLPAYRGKRLHSAGKRMALAAFTQRGARGLVSYVESNNFRSLRSTRRVGYRVFGDLYVVRALGRVHAWSTPGCRPYGFRLEPWRTPLARVLEHASS